MEANLGDRSNNLSIEQLLACGYLPLLVLSRKVCSSEMAKHTGHRNRTIPPWLGKGIIESIILDISITWDITLDPISMNITSKPEPGSDLTTWTWPPARCCATDFAIEGFSATQRILGAIGWWKS